MTLSWPCRAGGDLAARDTALAQRRRPWASGEARRKGPRCNAAGAITAALLIPTLMTRLYSLARKSPCPLRFNIATEAGWDIGCGLGCLSAAAMLTLTGSLTPAILLGLIGAAAAATQLLRGYGGD